MAGTNTSRSAAREAQRQQDAAAADQTGDKGDEQTLTTDAPTADEPTESVRATEDEKEEETYAPEGAVASGPTADRDPVDEDSNVCMLGGNAEPHDAEFVTTSNAVSKLKFCAAHRPANYQTLGYEKL